MPVHDLNDPLFLRGGGCSLALLGIVTDCRPPAPSYADLLPGQQTVALLMH